VSLLNTIADAIEDGEIPLHLAVAVQLTPARLRTAWNRTSDAGTIASLLGQLRPAELVDTLRALCPAMVEFVGLPEYAMLPIQSPAQWEFHWDTKQLVSIRHRGDQYFEKTEWSDEGSQTNDAWWFLSEVARAADRVANGWTINLKFAISRLIDSGLETGDDVAIILKTGAPPTLDEIIAAAERVRESRAR